MDKNKFPETLQEAVLYFSDEDTCIKFFADLRWPDGKPVCPNCGQKERVSHLSTRRVWKCLECKKQFSVKIGSIFEESAIPLSKWLPAVWLIGCAKNGISSYEVSRALGVTQKSAWFMLHRIRLAMQCQSFEKFGGESDPVEVDETYIGGLARNMHADRRKRKIQGRTGYMGKIAVFGLLDRGKNGKSRVKAHVVPDSWQKAANSIIKETVEAGSNVFTDEHGNYFHLGDAGFNHAFVRHAEEYVRGNVHTNGIENFWSLLKRGIKGTYVSVEPFHMFRYLDEQCFRFNERFGNDGDRFLEIMAHVAGRRLTYEKLTGKREDQTYPN
jgi:transposase-like protein